MRTILAVGLSCFILTLSAQTDLLPVIQDLRTLVSIPNNGLSRTDIDKNIAWLDSALLRRGMETRVLETQGNPLLFAQMIVNDQLPTVLFYAHLDGQPVDVRKWDQDDPYDAVLKAEGEDRQWHPLDWKALQEKIDPDWRIFGRSAADDKAPIVAFLHSLDRLQAEGKRPEFNVKLILDAEEELGSPNLSGAVDQYRDLLAADIMLIHDGPVHISGLPTLIFGCRGITTLDLTVYGPALPQHSGHYGNYAPNPVFRLAHLLSSMKDEEGRVTIEGYYDGINITDAEKEIMDGVPDDPGKINDLLQISEPDKVGSTYQESLQYPSLNARGIQAGWVGSQARTIVPDYATVAIDIRLVPESDPQRLHRLIRSHIEKQGFHIVEHEPTKEERLTYPKIVYVHSARSTAAFRTPMNSPAGRWLSQAFKTKFGSDPVKIRMMGGTVPITDFVSKLDMPAIIVPIVNADNNQHSPNENMRIGHLSNALEIFETILSTPIQADDGW